MKAMLLFILYLLISPANATTIAWDGKTLAADSQITTGTSIKSKTCKITKVRNAWIATAGPVDAGIMFRRWYANGHYSDAYPNIKDGFTAYVLTNKGIVQYWNTPVAVPVSPGSAIGTGREAAMGAMRAGANATRAVEIASEIDLFSSGPVVSHVAGELEK